MMHLDNGERKVDYVRRGRSSLVDVLIKINLVALVAPMVDGWETGFA